MSPLKTDINLTAPDDVYEALVSMHRDLTPDQSLAANSRLILLLANHIGDKAVLDAAIARARAGLAPQKTAPDA